MNAEQPKSPLSHLDLLRRLTAIRVAVRRRLFFYGLSIVAGGGLFTLTLIIFLDWWLWLPAALRIAVGVLFILGSVVAVSHWIVRPLRARLALTAVARHLERRFPALGDALTSSIEFLHSPAHGSAAMIRRVIDDAADQVRRLPLEAALTIRPLARSAAVLSAVAAAGAMIAWAAPDWYSTGLRRYTRPFGEYEWPRRVEIRPLQGDMKVALGGALVVRMRVLRGMDEHLRGIVRVRDAARRISTFAMQSEGPADFYSTLEGVVSDLEYWFEAGDASTAAAPCRVTVVTPPAVAEALVRVFAPPYAQPRPPAEHVLTTGDLSATLGSTLAVSLRSTQPVGGDDQGRPTAALEFDRAEPVPLAFEAGDPTRLSGSFELRHSDVIRIVLKDPDGFENTARRDHRIVAVPDEPPRVTVTEPSAVTEITPTGSLMLRARVEDDLGVRDVRLAGTVHNRVQPIDVPLATDPAVTTLAPPPMAEVQHVWELATLNLRSGEVLTYRVVATDNFDSDETHGQSTASPPLRLKVISQSDLEARLRDEMALLEARVRDGLLNQQSLHDRLDSLNTAIGEAAVEAPAREASATDPSADDRRRGQVRDLAGRQLQLADQTHGLAGRFKRIVEHARLNGAFDAQTRDRAADAARQLEHTASGSMAQAARTLDHLAGAGATEPERSVGTDHPTLDTLGPVRAFGPDWPRASRAAAWAQTAAIDELQRVLRLMGQWGDFQGVVARTRDLLDRQQQLRTDAWRHGRDTAGQTAEALDDPQRSRLQRLVRQERQLAAEMDEWLSRGRALVQRMKAEDAASAQALETGLRTAIANRISERMEQAATALTDNRTAAAALDQRAAEAGLATVLSALEERQLRQLAELRKSVERLVDAVAEILRQQEELAAATDEGVKLKAAGEVFVALAEEQRRVRRNTQQVGEELSGAPSASKAAAEVKQAAETMQRAEQRLEAAAGPVAAAEQDDAIVALRSALEELQRLAAETEHQLMLKTLARTRRLLEEIRGGQEEVNEETAPLIEAMNERKRLDRATARRASRLATGQGELRERTLTVRTELEGTAVYGWVLDRVTEGMKVSREALAARRLDEALGEAQGTIIRELTYLIEALTSIEALPPPDQFVDGAGGGGSMTLNPAPVPPVAELIVIKTMQKALNERTAALHGALASSEPGEADLRRVQAIGQEQEQLRELTETVIRKARTGD